jgi:murein DD-endopeptidase MepM/ murein hydrolase activator NlpD
MIFQISKSILLALSALLMLLTACTQTPNYAPVKMVNQAIEPNNGYYFRKKVPTRPLNKPDKPQETAKSALNEQQDNPVGQPPASNNLPYPSPYQNKPSQNYSTDQAVKKEPIPSSTLGIAAQNQGVRKPNPLPYTVESLTKNKSAHPGVDKDSISSQHESPITDQQTNNHPKNKSIPSSANPIASQKTPQHNAQPPDNNLLASKNIKEKTSIISIDNKKMLKLNFEWPLKGKISRNFAQTDNKGIDITGKTGQAVQAAAQSGLLWARANRFRKLGDH